jgi:hypothetical protein
VNNFGNRLIGLGTKSIAEGAEAGMLVARGANITQKILGKTYKVLSKPLTEGLYEEGFQGVAAKTMQDYLSTKYDPSNTHGYDMFASVTDAFADQYGTKEGWKEMGIGMIIGFAGGAVQGQGFEGFGKNSYKYAADKLQQEIATTNEGVQKLRGLNRTSSARMFANKAQEESGIQGSVSNTISNTEFIKSQESVKSPKEIKADFEAVIRNTDLEENVKQHLGSEEAQTAYKDNLIAEFNRNLDDYTFAKKAVRSIGLDQKLKATPGQLNEIGEALTMNLVLGKHALYSAQNVAEHIDKLVGTNGIYNHLQFYNSLNEQSKQAVEELRDKQARLDQLQTTAIKLGQVSAEVQKRGKDASGINKAYESVSEKVLLVEQEAAKLQEDVDRLTKTLDKNQRAVTFELDGSVAVADTPNSILNTVNELDKLDQYTQDLRENGRNDVADTIDDLVTEFKRQSDAHREVNNTARKMMDTNFFSSKEGTSLVDTVIGKRYSMSDDFKKLIEDNDKLIDQSLDMVGIRGEDKVLDRLQAVLEENQELSDREKYRLESIIRLQLTQQHLQEQVDAEIAPATITEVSEDTTPDPLIGDTVSLKERLDITAENLTTIEVLDRAIKTITESIDKVVNRRGDRNKAKIEELKNKLQTLKQQRDAIEKTNQQNEEGLQPSSEQKYSGIGERQQTSGQIEGQQGQGTSNEANNSNSNIASETQEVVAAIEENKSEIDQLIEARLKQYGIQPTDLFEDMSEADELLMNKAKSGQKVDIEALKGTIDYIYSKYKEVIRLKNEATKEERVQKGLTDNQIKEIQKLLEEDLDFLQTYKNAYEEGQTLPTITFETENQINEPSRVGTESTVSNNGGTTESSTTTNNPQTLEEFDKAILETEAQIDELSKPFKIIDSEEYLRFSELTRKMEKDGRLPDEEATELETLREDINQWLLITGTVANGLRLSDLIRQREALNVAAVLPLETPTEVTPEDVIEGVNFVEVNRGNANYSIAQSYDAVMVTSRKDGNIVISGISLESLEELAGIGKIDTVYDETNSQNNIIITPEVAQKINENADSDISILPTIKDSVSSYSFAIKNTVDMNGNAISVPLKTSFDDFSSEMDTESIYNIEDADALRLSVDPNDEYNIQLIEAYQEAKGAKAKNEALEALKRGLVIRVKHKDKFVAVLKGKSSRAKSADRSDEKFEMLRDMIVEMPNMLENLQANTEISLNDFNISVKKVLPGQPSFLMSKNSDGSINILYKDFDDTMTNKVEDIGVIDKGSIQTQSGEKGLDTTFLRKYSDNRATEKVPFVVVRKGNRRIAYPVKLKPQAKKDNSKFSDIFNSNTLTITQKIVNLNKFMAERGIDVKKPGEAFFSANLTPEFFNKKLNQLNSIDYFYSLEDWVQPGKDISSILKQQASINIDLSNPVHSPKIQINFDNVYAGITLPEVSSEQKTKTNKETVTQTNKTSKSLALEALEARRKNC